ncbi:MAG: hypothetical protein HQK58_11115 [Deltaproteobacteria bacterium]|nr:hypothetical protein [Deltaproteobacteria bacterium]
MISIRLAVVFQQPQEHDDTYAPLTVSLSLNDPKFRYWVLLIVFIRCELGRFIPCVTGTDKKRR